MKPSNKVIVISAARLCDLLTITAGRTSVDIQVNRSTHPTLSKGVVAIDSVHSFSITGAEHDDPDAIEEHSADTSDTKIPNG